MMYFVDQIPDATPDVEGNLQIINSLSIDVQGKKIKLYLQHDMSNDSRSVIIKPKGSGWGVRRAFMYIDFQLGVYIFDSKGRKQKLGKIELIDKFTWTMFYENSDTYRKISLHKPDWKNLEEIELHIADQYITKNITTEILDTIESLRF